MITRYPYKLFILQPTSNDVDENGFATESTEDFQFLSMCRDYPAGSGDIITTESGDVSKASSVVMLPKGVNTIKVNCKIKIENQNGQIRLMANVLRFEEGQLHSRLWV